MVELRPESQINLIFNLFTLLSLNFFHSYCSQNMLPHTTLTYITLCSIVHLPSLETSGGFALPHSLRKHNGEWKMNDYSVSYCRLLNKLIRSLTKENNNHFTSPNFFFKNSCRTQEDDSCTLKVWTSITQRLAGELLRELKTTSLTFLALWRRSLESLTHLGSSLCKGPYTKSL